MNSALFEGAAGYPHLIGLWIYLACALFMGILAVSIALRMKKRHQG